MKTTQNINKPRILIIDNSPAVTGAVIAAIRCSMILKEHFDFIFVLPKGSLASAYVEKKGFRVLEIPMLELQRNPVSLFMYWPMLVLNTIRFFRLVKEQKIDLIHVNDFYNMIPPFYKLLGGELKYICHVRFLPDRFPKILIRTWSYFHKRYAFSIIAVSQALRRKLIYMNRIIVIGDGLPPEEVDFSKTSSNIMLYPANFTRGKGQEYAIKSFAVIAQKYQAWKLRFVGGDMGLKKNADFKEELKLLATDAGIADQIEWKDFSDNMASEYIDASIVLNFSESESFSLTCLEALYYGRPVIATDSGGPSEIIDHNETGIIVPKRDVISMSVAMEVLMADDHLCEKMAITGRARVRERFPVGQTAHRMKDQYLSMLTYDKPVERVTFE